MSDGHGTPIDARSDARPDIVDAEFRAFVGDPRFPCLGGASVVRRRSYRLHVYGALGQGPSSEPLADDLENFIWSPVVNSGSPRAFIAVFPEYPPETEHDFEGRLWLQLQMLHNADGRTLWDPSVSSDPDDPRFSFSFAGRAFFVVGLHPHSSRLARRFRWPALVFNPHSQFERLRTAGHYKRYQSLIRERDIALQGSVNPNLAEFGERSEARQYSGRATESEWRCPFHPNPK
jgi:FPC/CPF motif-containing protein YcgG